MWELKTCTGLNKHGVEQWKKQHFGPLKGKLNTEASWEIVKEEALLILEKGCPELAAIMTKNVATVYVEKNRCTSRLKKTSFEYVKLKCTMGEKQWSCCSLSVEGFSVNPQLVDDEIKSLFSAKENSVAAYPAYLLKKSFNSAKNESEE